MSQQIVGYVDTVIDADTGDYRTDFHWSVPAELDDAEHFVKLMSARFADELRRTIQAHQ